MLLLIITGVQVIDSGQIRTGFSAFGVDLSGMTRAEATAALTATIDVQSRETLQLTDGSESWSLSKRELGLRVDVTGIVEDAFAQGRSGWGPSRLAIL